MPTDRFRHFSGRMGRCRQVSVNTTRLLAGEQGFTFCEHLWVPITSPDSRLIRTDLQKDLREGAGFPTPGSQSCTHRTKRSCPPTSWWMPAGLAPALRPDESL